MERGGRGEHGGRWFCPLSLVLSVVTCFPAPLAHRTMQRRRRFLHWMPLSRFARGKTKNTAQDVGVLQPIIYTGFAGREA